MKRIALGIVVFSLGAVLSTASGTPQGPTVVLPDSASGEGTISYGEDGHTAGFFLFDVEGADSPTGSLQFAAEDHHRYPEIVVRLDKISRVRFGQRWVRFSGQGALQDEPVTVTVRAYDGEAANRPDRFAIRCTNSDGKVVFSARGQVSSGNIFVGEPS